ncbi:MAG: Nitric oxide -responding transcriptional regulator Dnr (Crp/Fnr family) [uncultured Sulfurovum sp.]|uniref:Nitric oxide -responding transcriptional regulator Dnr (Crp/Fnr family) n=1 Tax=uncultured Sulfurovum sp. TaxID=269237 RepID=A0A6S6SES0_9BACT|nr:MAG: Nitric oxide -responding transcriptional regulator Dnr (Crp/Fnr family) [uncultured Sulfurovum sp.]
MNKILKTALLILVLPNTILVANNEFNFSSLVNDFMNENNSLKKSINLSGKQRMLTQKMSKLSLQIMLDIQKQDSQSKLLEEAFIYDITLKAFKEGNDTMGITKATNMKVLKQITIVEKAWKPFYGHLKNISQNMDDNKSFHYIMLKNENLLKLSDELVHHYEFSNTSENYLEKSRLRMVNVAGRQRMLTQKMTKEKLFFLQGEKTAKNNLVQSIQLFDESLTALMEGNLPQHINKATNKKIVKQLKVVSTLWQQLKPLYEKEKNSVKELSIIIESNELLLKEMNKVVHLAETEVEY